MSDPTLEIAKILADFGWHVVRGAGQVGKWKTPHDFEVEAVWKKGAADVVQTINRLRLYGGAAIEAIDCRIAGPHEAVTDGERVVASRPCLTRVEIVVRGRMVEQGVEP